MENFREHLINPAHYITQAIFSSTIMWLRDTGILDKVKYDVMNPPIPIPDPTVRQNEPLILRQLGIIMIVLVVGLAVGTVMFFVELCINTKGAPEEGKTDLGKASVLPKPDLGKTCQKSNFAISEEGKTELGQILKTRFRQNMSRIQI